MFLPADKRGHLELKQPCPDRNLQFLLLFPCGERYFLLDLTERFR